MVYPATTNLLAKVCVFSFGFLLHLDENVACSKCNGMLHNSLGLLLQKV
jgi:hypothetical protein